ncbi:glycoside hydrolase family 3 protein [Halopelagius longus]|uniref:Beta-glucosidase n=1 Tax=Halopelagius longus TaxID=1236180 RepID=A0A1H1FKM4_9EURY|nr:glycoside hydrolase family 3 protein [Halopelagius longus]RDI70057.1 beta-glucosidase [Halopelagius longus]SDR01437.1 beta-glucosidase [Halopelagius longus]
MVDTTRRDVLLGLGAGTGLVLAGDAVRAQSDESTSDEPYRDADRPMDDRVAKLVGRLTTEEKISLLHQYQPPIRRVGLGAFRTGTEALHGVSWLEEATVFPQAIGLGSTWDPDLVERVGSAVGDEVRGKHDATHGGVGLNVWSPTVDPLRDPRWGRNEEGYSEDPLLSGEAGTAYVRGLAGQDSEYLKTAPTLKHFIGYNNETERTTTNAEIPPRLLRDYYAEFFRRPMESGDAVGVMASYNLVNGRPMTVSPMLDEMVREWAPDGSKVMNVSDAWAPVNLTGAQEYFESDAVARAAAVKAGLDSFTEYGSDSSTTTDALATALEEGHLDEAELDEAVGHVLSVRFRLGEFDPDSEVPYADITDDVIGRPEHRELAREAARKQAVLLKNDDDGDGVLPLSSDETVAVVGPLSESVFEDWYSGTPPYRITVQEGVRDRIGAENLRSAKGADTIALRHAESDRYVTAGVSAGGGGLGLNENEAPSVQLFDAVQWDERSWTLLASANQRYVTVDGDGLVNAAEAPAGWETVAETFEFVDVGGDAVALRHRQSDTFVAVEEGSLVTGAESESDAATFVREVRESGIDAAIEAVSEADAAVVTVGTHPLIGGRETKDREDLGLAPRQQELLERVVDEHPRTAVLLQTSYPVTMGGAQADAGAVLWSSHAGQETGRALSDVLFGSTAPGGRLPQTWPKSVEQLPDITNYNIAETGATYRYGDDDPLYAFGHGLSYSTFEYGDLQIPNSALTSGDAATISVEVTNAGSRAADEVAQLYTCQQRSRTDQPRRVLRGFERVRLDAGESTTVEFEVDHDEFAFWDVTRNERVVERSRHRVFVGSASDDIRARGTLRVDGEEIPPRTLSEPTRAVDADDWTWSEIDLLDRSKSEGTVVGMTADSWVSFADVDLREKPTEATVSFARPESGTATVELRRGSPSGTVLGRTDVESTGGEYAYEDATFSLEKATGKNRELYLVARGAVRVHTLRLG